MYLSGEHSLHYIGPDNDLRGDYDSPKFPLYLFAEIALMNLDSLFIYEPGVSDKNKKKAQELREQVEELRAKLVTLNHSESFDSNKHISPEAWKGMASCRGSFRSAEEEKGPKARVYFSRQRRRGAQEEVQKT